MKFTKMQGIGNDYVYVNCFEETVKDPAAVAKFVSDRHFGIGSDGLILICPSEVADCRMRMFNEIWTALRVPCAETVSAALPNMSTTTASWTKLL